MDIREEETIISTSSYETLEISYKDKVMNVEMLFEERRESLRDNKYTLDMKEYVLNHQSYST